MAAAIASGLIRQKRQAREQHAHRPTAHRRRKSPGKKQGLCNGNLVDIFSKVRIFGLKKRRLRRQGVEEGGCTCMHTYTRLQGRKPIDTHVRARFYTRMRVCTFTHGHILCTISFTFTPWQAGARVYARAHARASTPNMQKYTLPDSAPVSLSLCIIHLSFPSVVWHTLAGTVMPCCALWFSSFQVHPLLKPQISLSSLSLSACLYVDLCLALSFSAHNWKCLITKITLCLNTSKMSDKNPQN